MGPTSEVAFSVSGRGTADDLDDDIDSILADDDDDSNVNSLSSVRMHEGNLVGGFEGVGNKDASAVPGNRRDSKEMVQEPLYSSNRYGNDKKSFRRGDGDVTDVAEYKEGDLGRAEFVEGERGYQRQTSHTLKIYQEGQYVDVSGRDSDYHSNSSSSASPPESSSNPGKATNKKRSMFATQRTDPLSRSLQDWDMKEAMAKNKSVDLSASMNAGGGTKCVYDARMFQVGNKIV